MAQAVMKKKYTQREKVLRRVSQTPATPNPFLLHSTTCLKTFSCRPWSLFKSDCAMSIDNCYLWPCHTLKWDIFFSSHGILHFYYACTLYLVVSQR